MPLRILTPLVILAWLAYRLLPDCWTANCRQPLVWRWRRLDDGQLHPHCGRCARHIDRLRAARRPSTGAGR